MRAEVFLLDLRLRRRMLLGTAVGAAAYLFVVIAVYPTFRTDTSFDAVIAANPAAAAAFGVSGSITTPAGWLSANMYANVAPLLALMLTIGYGAAAIAGQDNDGLLGLIVTQPVSRAGVVVGKLVAMLAVAVVVPVAAYAVCLAGPRFQLRPEWGAVAGVSAAIALLAFDFGVFALLIGVLTHRRGAALGLASGVAAAAYLVSSLAPVNSTVHSLRLASPFYWAVGANQLDGGTSWGGLAALAVLGVVLALAAIAAFRRADVQ